MEDKTDQRAMAGVLRETITDEVFAAFGLASRGWQRRLFGPVFWFPTQIFGRIMAGIDQTVGEQGIPEAAKRLLRYFVDDVQVSGKENIPPEGPVLIASNHPGAYDSVAILASLPRKDVKIVVSDIPFLRSMPAASRMMVYATPGTQGRMTAVRGVVRQMQIGGVIMIFPSGLVDPDPDVLPGADKELGSWSGSLDLVMKKVPETKIIVTMVSGVLSPICLRNPLTHLPKKEWEQRKLAEFLQVIQQLALKRKFGLKPRLTFDVPLTGAELMAQYGSSDLHQAILSRARRVLRVHMETAPNPV
jgi:Acyltransferase